MINRVPEEKIAGTRAKIELYFIDVI